MEAHLFEFAALFGVLGLAATMSIWLRLPVVPLYIAAGLLIGVAFEPSEVVEFLGTLGVVFLLFSMGLEFSVATMLRRPTRFILPGSIDLLFNFPVGLLVGWLLGWTLVESLFLAGILYMSSSAVVSKCIADFGRAARPETETILSIMVFEDLVIALYLLVMGSSLVQGAGSPDVAAAVAGEAGAEGASAGQGIFTIVGVALFVALLGVLARRFQAPLERLIATHSDEGFTLALFAFVLLVASAGTGVGLSGEIGAFLAGMVVGATKLKERAALQLLPYQTVFAALFFISFGMSLDPASLLSVALPATALVIVGFATKTLGGYVAARSIGRPPLQATIVGFSLVPKGEFSIVIAALAASAGGGSEIIALTGFYVFALSIGGPIAMREAENIYRLFRRTRPANAKKTKKKKPAA